MKLEIGLLFSLVFLLALLGLQIFRRQFLEKHIRKFYFIAIAGVFLVASIYSYLQYMAWHNAPPPASYLLPPYQSIDYFLFYVFARFYANSIIAFLLSLLALWSTKWLNKLIYPTNTITGGVLIVVGHRYK